MIVPQAGSMYVVVETTQERFEAPRVEVLVAYESVDEAANHASWLSARWHDRGLYFEELPQWSVVEVPVRVTAPGKGKSRG